MSGVIRESSLDLKGLLPTHVAGPFQPFYQFLLAKLFAFGKIERTYRSIPAFRSPSEFARAVLDQLGVHFVVRSEEQFRIPAHGPAIVVANHPFGGLEGLFMIWLLTCLRGDVRILANLHLSRIPELKPVFYSINPFGGRAAARTNVTGLRQALRWVKGGGLLLLFPAGEVAHLDVHSGTVSDPAWSPIVARLIRLAEAPVLPVFIDGRNSLHFQLAGLIHPRLRTVLLARELFNKRRKSVPVRIGHPIPHARLQGIRTDEDLAAHLRVKTYMLGAATAKSSRARTGPALERDYREPIPAPIARERLQEEIAALPPDQLLVESGEFRVYHAEARQIPWLLQELGRCRELTFRTVGEGTGRSSDIDLFDDYYEHLFVWNVERGGELVGAYRLGQVDRIRARFGKRGLYTATLFDYRHPLLAQLEPALELGRSFVMPEYQKSFAALMLLWKGIAEYLVRHPKYRVLFGAVSISNDYALLSKEMLIEFLRHHNYESRLAKLVRARQPFRRPHDLRLLSAELKGLADLEALSALVSDIEPDGKGVPILLRQYLKLGGRLLGFNVDPAFNDSIDCLIMVDLLKTDPRVLNKYMGREKAEAFLAFHSGARPVEQVASG
ncbi:MAG TPA: GNAT family N-acyltransferase [Steroidobacteraceae bacterium]|nr:GNAT family N-acyltransferase [Steroidobacteraceae bacterium]